MPTKRRPYQKILSIDGGGIRWLIPALILQEIEHRTDRPIHTLFDLIVGTSTGGILAIGLTKPGKPLSAEALVALYRDEGNTIFDRSLLKRVRSLDGIADERYHEGPLEQILMRLFRAAQLKNTRCDLIITAYDIEQRTPYLFKSHQARVWTLRVTTCYATSPARRLPRRLISSRFSWMTSAGHRKRSAVSSLTAGSLPIIQP